MVADKVKIELAASDRVPSQVLCELCDALDYAYLSSLLLDNFQIRASSPAQGMTIEDGVFRSFNCLPALPAQRTFHINPQFLQKFEVCRAVERLRITRQWARAHQGWLLPQWRHVLFSDESRFGLVSDDYRERVWRERGGQHRL
nr:unnamed protein product [Callosobruchus chinensis]